MDGTRRDVIEALLALRGAAAYLTATLDRLDDTASRLVSMLDDGVTPSEAHRSVEFTAARDAVFSAIDRFDRAFANARAHGVRLLVEEEGLSLTDVGRLVGRSRQFVTRLYDQVRSTDAD